MPFPWLLLPGLPMNPGGSLEVLVPGSAGTPVSVFMQVIDPGIPGLSFSNAIEAVIGF